MSKANLTPNDNEAPASGHFDALTRQIAAQPDIEAGLVVLLGGLADRIKATSNDQNIQRLSRAIRAASPSFAAAFSGMGAKRYG